MSKFPEPPGVGALRRITAETTELAAGTLLARIYFAAGPYPSHWNQFRRFGPTAARWDHHLPDAGGAPTAIHSGPRSRTRAWARQLYEAYPHIHGVQYGSSMNGHAPAIALNDRAQRAMPVQPQFHRALKDDILVEVLQRMSLRISYGLR